MKTTNQLLRKIAQSGARLITMGLVAAAIFLDQNAKADFANPTPVNLGSAAYFDILAGSAININGAVSTITGDIGLSPISGTYITFATASTVNGTIYTVDAGAPTGLPPASATGGIVPNSSALLAMAMGMTGLNGAYLNAAGRASNATYPELGALILGQGVYTGSSLDLAANTTLTLDAKGNPNAVFIFQAGSTLTLGANSQIILINGAQAANVFWQVGASATIGSGAAMDGNILALTSITLDSGATLDGRALALNAAVTLEASGNMFLPELAGLATNSIWNKLNATNIFSGFGSFTNSLGAGAGQWQLTNGVAGSISAIGGTLTVNIGGASATITNGTTFFSPSLFILNQSNATAALTFMNGINLSGTNLEIDVNAPSNAPTYFKGVISDSVGGAVLTKGCTGVLILSTNNTYTGGTLISAGTLRLGINNALFSNGVVNVNSAGTFDLGGFNQIIDALNGVAGSVVTNSGGPATLTIGNANGNGLFGGVITDAGVGNALSLVKTGTGMEALSGNNTYSGGTTINGGTLLLAINNALFSNGVVTVNAAGTLYIGGFNQIIDALNGVAGSVVTNSGGPATLTIGNANGNGLFGGVIADAGVGNALSLVKTGTGTETLSGTNTYSGGTTISGGVLQFNDGGSVLGAITNNSALVFNSSGIVTNGNTISGTGSLTQIGTGKLELDGANTYSGGTVITNSGTIVIGNNTALGSGNVQMWNRTAIGVNGVINLANNIQVNGDPTFDSTGGTLTLSGVISGGGDVYITGTNAIIFTGNNTYTGDTTISNGTLQVGNGGTSGTLGSGNVTNLSFLVFARSDSISVSNNITGNGSLTQAGSGTLVINSANTYSGGTVVNGGTLTVANSHALGSGNLGVLNGTLQTGSAQTGIPLSINVGGNYLQYSAGTLALGIGGTALANHDWLNITGTAILNGTLTVLPLNGYSPNLFDSVVLITASGGVASNTTFATFNNQIVAPLLQANLLYNPNNVTLTWSQLPLAPYALTPNQQATAGALDSAANNPVMKPLLANLDTLPTSQLPAAFDLISPEQLTAMPQMAFAGMDARGQNFLSRVNDLHSNTNSHGFSSSRFSLNDTSSSDLPVYQTADAAQIYAMRADDPFNPSLDNPWGVYIEGNGEFLSQGSDANASGYHATSGGVTIGLDRRLCDQFVVGLTLGYADVSASLNNGGYVNANDGQASLYAAWFNQGLHMEGMIGGGYSSYETQRGTIGGNANGKTDGTEFTGMIGGGYDWQTSIWNFGPQLTLQYKQANIGSFTETGSLAPLNILSQSDDSLQSSLGAHVGCQTTLGKVIVAPSLSLAWQHEFLANSMSLDSSFANGAGNIFNVRGPAVGADSVLLGVGVVIKWTPRIATYLNYTTELGRENYNIQNVNAGMSFLF